MAGIVGNRRGCSATEEMPSRARGGARRSAVLVHGDVGSAHRPILGYPRAMGHRLVAVAFAVIVSGCGGANPAAPTSTTPVDTNAPVDATSPSAPTDLPETTVSREELRASFTPPSAAYEQLRVVPVGADGGQTGYRLFGIRVGSLPARAGLTNGDLVTALGGVALRSTHVAREAVDAMLEAEVIVVELERRGAPMRLRVRVTP